MQTTGLLDSCVLLRCGRPFISVVQCLCTDAGFTKAIPLQFLDKWHMKVARLTVLHTGSFYPPRKYSWYSFVLEAESTHRIKPMKSPSDIIGNRLVAAVPQ